MTDRSEVLARQAWTDCSQQNIGCFINSPLLPSSHQSNAPLFGTMKGAEYVVAIAASLDVEDEDEAAGFATVLCYRILLQSKRRGFLAC